MTSILSNKALDGGLLAAAVLLIGGCAAATRRNDPPPVSQYVKDADGPFQHQDATALTKFQDEHPTATNTQLGKPYQAIISAAQGADIGPDAVGLTERVFTAGVANNYGEYQKYAHTYRAVADATEHDLETNQPATLGQENQREPDSVSLGNRFIYSNPSDTQGIPGGLVADTVEKGWDPKIVGADFAHEFEAEVHKDDTRGGQFGGGTVTHQHPPTMDDAEMAKIVASTEADVTSNKAPTAYPKY
jgi:hypothetical protein